jgi:hypothetical protein
VTTNDSVWVDDEKDPLLDENEPAEAAQPRARSREHIGCPLVWLKRVVPVAKSKGDILVWLWLWRLRSVRRSRTIKVSNSGLAGLGITRYTKYRSLKRFAKAGLIDIARRDGNAIVVTFRKGFRQT